MTDCDHCTTHHHACDCREYEHALQVECLESALATHVDRICALTAKCDELQSIIDGQRDTMGSLKRKLALLREYAEHHDSCGDYDAYNNADIRSCGCGLDSVSDAIDSERDAE